jgi:predicted RNA binding protein YcfA (HicA-like mRNA interferase family)
MSGRLPALKPRQVIRARERAGFVFDRASGGHRYFVHSARPDLLVRMTINR